MKVINDETIYRIIYESGYDEYLIPLLDDNFLLQKKYDHYFSLWHVLQADDDLDKYDHGFLDFLCMYLVVKYGEFGVTMRSGWITEEKEFREWIIELKKYGQNYDM